MQLLKCVSFLLGAAILSAIFRPFVAIAHGELLMELTDGNALTGQMMFSGDAGVKKTEPNNRRSIPNSGAKHSVEKCGHGARKDQSVNCQFRSRKLHPRDYFGGHIPYTGDYRKPQHHPPKNN